MIVAMYTEEFYRLSLQCDLSMTEEQQAAKYIISLKYLIQEHVILHDVFSVDEAHNKVMRIERLQSRASPFKSVAEKTSDNTRTQQSFTLSDRLLAQKSTSAPTTSLMTSTTHTKKGKENSYVKLGVGKCYRFGEPGHKPNECPRRRQVNMVDYEDEDEVKIETEPEDSVFAEEHGE